MLEEAEIVRISKSEYDTMVANAKRIQEYTDDANEARTVMKFTDRNNFPTVEEMKQHDVIHNLRKYLPFLIYYHTQEVFASDVEELERSKEYINEVLSEFLEIVDDEDVAAINALTPGVWKKAGCKQRHRIFAPLIAYYGWNEFETFIKDLGWKKFMGAYNYTQKNAKDGEDCPKLRDDLAKIWDELQPSGD